MIPLMAPAADERIYIDSLCKIVDRKVNTIRKWERLGMLPRHLMPKRGKRNWRYWTHEQVYGKRGIIEWMERENMRPGNLMTHPDKEAEHVEKLRRPKYLTATHIYSARRMADNGRTAAHIVKKILPRTKYVKPEGLEAALRRMAEVEGWKFPE